MVNLTGNIASIAVVAVGIGVCGATFAFGVAVVWRWMKWAPINIIVNVTHRED